MTDKKEFDRLSNFVGKSLVDDRNPDLRRSKVNRSKLTFIEHPSYTWAKALSYRNMITFLHFFEIRTRPRKGTSLQYKNQQIINILSVDDVFHTVFL